MCLFTDKKTNRSHLKKWERKAIEEFENLMGNQTQPFPCIPATQGYILQQFRFGFAGDPRNESSTKELSSFLSNYTEISRSLGTYTTLIVFFETPIDLRTNYTVELFEQLFWEQLNRLRYLDMFEWPKEIPTEPDNPFWEFCFHKEKYFMYCATPAHKSRRSRYFSTFMMAITPRWVLEQFHLAPTYANKIKERIRQRVAKYDTISIHPNLNSYGLTDNFEWKQYFLRDDETTLPKCPFHTMYSDKKKE